MAKARPATLGALLVLALAGPALAANDFRDVAIISATINMVLEGERSGVKVDWSNPETGNSGYVVAERTFFLNPQSPCRDYRRSMRTAAGETVMVTGTGCRQPDGRWELDEQPTAQPSGSLASRSPGSEAPKRRSAIGGSPASEPKPEPPTPLTRRSSGTPRSSGRPARVGEPVETRSEPVARAPAPVSRAPVPSSGGVQPGPSAPEPVVRAPEPLTPPAREPAPQAAPEPEPEPEPVARVATPKAEPPRKAPAESRTAAKSAPAPKPAAAQPKDEPRVSVSLPSKSEG